MNVLEFPDDVWRMIGHEHLDRVDIVLLRLVCHRFEKLFKKPTFGWETPFDASGKGNRFATAFIFWSYGWEKASTYKRYARYGELASRLFMRAVSSLTVTEDAALELYYKFNAYEDVASAFHRDVFAVALRRRFFTLLQRLRCFYNKRNAKFHMRILRSLAAHGRATDLLFVLNASRLRPEDLLNKTEAPGVIMPLVCAAAAGGHLEVLVMLGRHYPAAFATRTGRQRLKMQHYFRTCHATPQMMQWLAMVYPATRSSWHRATKKAFKQGIILAINNNTLTTKSIGK